MGNLNELLIDLLNENKENFKRKQFENDVITNTRSNIFKLKEPNTVSSLSHTLDIDKQKKN